MKKRKTIFIYPVMDKFRGKFGEIWFFFILARVLGIAWDLMRNIPSLHSAHYTNTGQLVYYSFMHSSTKANRALTIVSMTFLRLLGYGFNLVLCFLPLRMAKFISNRLRRSYYELPMGLPRQFLLKCSFSSLLVFQIPFPDPCVTSFRYERKINDRLLL